MVNQKDNQNQVNNLIPKLSNSLMKNKKFSMNFRCILILEMVVQIASTSTKKQIHIDKPTFFVKNINSNRSYRNYWEILSKSKLKARKN